MKITPIGEQKIIMENPHSKHNYFAWPTVTRLQNGKIAVVASGYRLRHVCPFGKMVISYSENEGESYTAPAPIIDTPLDDRDGGILAFGEKEVIVTSFTNTVEFQRKRKSADAYNLSYLDKVTFEEEEKYLGPTFRISHDCGVTFDKEVYISPVTSPHGPCELSDGSVLWVGRISNRRADFAAPEMNKLRAYKINTDGTTEYVGSIENVEENGVELRYYEPHAICLDDGKIICHIRTENEAGKEPMFTVFQTESYDGGKTWTKPYQILSRLGGSPPHILKTTSGMLVMSYAYREEPSSIKIAFSHDGGESWDTEHLVCVNGKGWDMGYPSTVELKDGSFLTVFYAHPEEDAPAVIMQQKWKIEE